MIRSIRHPKSLLLAPIPGVVFVVAVGAILWTTFLGDPSIYLPFARNLAHGQLFRFNPHGEFSTGVASPIWTCILAVPFALGFGVMSVKVVALATTIVAVALVATAVGAATASTALSALGALFVASHLAYWGDTAYDSAVAVILSAGAVLAGLHLQRQVATRGSLDSRDVWPLAVLFGLLPLGRADLTILMPLELVALWAGGVIRTPRDAKRVLWPTLLALIPAAIYYGAAFIDTGSYSVSSAARTYDQKLTAKHLGPLLYSREALDFLRAMAWAIAVAFVGCALLVRQQHTRWLGVFCASGTVVYALVIVFFPVTFYVERYSLPAIPLIAVGMTSTVALLRGRRTLAAAIAGAVLLLTLNGLRSPFDTARAERANNYSFAEITEREVAMRIAAVAPPGATVLGYEVQDRWMLRPDLRLLAVNGIIDGHVFPYRDSGNLRGFLWRYKPEFWIANQPVLTMPYLRDSVLGTAYRRFLAGQKSFQTSGIRFAVFATRHRPVPYGFAGWHYLVRLGYVAR